MQSVSRTLDSTSKTTLTNFLTNFLLPRKSPFQIIITARNERFFEAERFQFLFRETHASRIQNKAAVTHSCLHLELDVHGDSLNVTKPEFA